MTDQDPLPEPGFGWRRGVTIAVLIVVALDSAWLMGWLK